LNKGPAPKSLAFIVIYRRADFLIGGVPFLILRRSIIIFLSFYSLRVSSSSLTSLRRAPKYPTSSGLMLGRELDYMERGVCYMFII